MNWVPLVHPPDPQLWDLEFEYFCFKVVGSTQIIKFSGQVDLFI